MIELLLLESGGTDNLLFEDSSNLLLESSGSASATSLLHKRRRSDVMIFRPGITSQSVDVQIVDDAGLPVTGLVAATFPTVKYSISGANSDVTVTLSDLASIGAAYSSGGLRERGEGVYRLDLPDAVFSSSGLVTVRGESSGKRLLLPKIIVAMVAANAVQINGTNQTARDIGASVLLAANQDVRNVSGDVSGKVLGGGASAMTGAGVRAVDGSGNAIAPASTALSTSQWTNTRAGLLDNLDAAVSTRSTLTQTQVTGGAYSIASALCVLGDTRIANLDAAVSTRSTYAGSDTSGTTTLLTRLSSTRAGYLDNLAVAPITSLGTNAPTGWINSAAFAAGATLPRVTLVDTTTTNTDMLTATAVWSAATRTLTSAGSGGATAQEVWEYATRTLTSGGGGGLTASDVWSHATRTLTAGTNIVLAKGTGVTGFNDLDGAGVRGAVGLATANLDTQLADLPTNAELSTALAGADDATLAAIAALNNVSAAQVLSAIQGWTVETGRTFSDVVKGIAAALIGDVVGNGATYRGFGVATTRLSVSSDENGNRTITYTG
jgi:hypothetical protein